MPLLTLSATKTAGNDEVLKTLQYLSRGTLLYRNGCTLQEVTEYLQQNGHFNPHPALLATLQAQVLTVLNNLITLGYVTTTTNGVTIGDEGKTGYKLTRTGILPARRARPYALRP